MCVTDGPTGLHVQCHIKRYLHIIIVLTQFEFPPPLRYKSDVGGLIKDCFPSDHAPACLKEYMSYVHSLSYTAAPDYRRMQQMFIKELGRCGLKDDGKGLDWIDTGKKVSVRIYSISCSAETTTLLHVYKIMYVIM